MTRRARLHGPPPPGYNWGIKLVLAVALLLLSISMTLQTVYVAPALHELALANATEKRQNACYDGYTADVTDGNAAVLASAVNSIAALNVLIVDLSATTRDPAVVKKDIDAIGAAAAGNKAATDAYNRAIKARKGYGTAGRPLPCPRPND